MKKIAVPVWRAGMFALILLYGLVMSLPISAVPAAASDSEIYPGSAAPDNIIGLRDGDTRWEMVFEEQTAALYVETSTGNFAFHDKISNYTWYSVPQDLESDKTTKGVKRTNLRSILNVGYVDMSSNGLVATPSYVNSYAGSLSADAAKMKTIPRGVRIEYTFPDQEFMIPIEITLTDGILSASVPLTEIKESPHYSITTIELLPYFMSAGKQAQGYILIPQGSGALINLNNGKDGAAPFDSMVYGRDQIIQPDTAPLKEDHIVMPVYGIHKDEAAMAAIITGGDTSASIVAHISDDSIGYNKVASKLNYRTIDSTTLFEKVPASKRDIYRLSPAIAVTEKYEVRFYPLSGDNADYAGMAKAYRQYLQSNGLLNIRASQPTLNLELYGAIRKPASFLGFPYEKLSPLTTFKQANEIVNELTDAGIGHISIRYTGWENGGVDNQKIPSGVKAVSCLGGNKQLKVLNDFITQKGHELYLTTDFINYTKSGNSFSSSRDSAQNIFHMPVKRIRYMLSVQVESLSADSPYFLRVNRINRAVDSYLPQFLKQNAGGISLKNMGDTVYSDYSDSTGERAKTIEAYRQVFEKFRSEGINISVDSGNAYALPYADVVYNLPVTASSYRIFDEAVPFCQIVLSGAVRYTAPNINRETDKTTALLKCIETGSELLYAGFYEDSAAVTNTNYNYLYSSSFRDWKDFCIADYQKYYAIYQDLSGVSIDAHEKLADGVYRTTFKNGTRITVNYNTVDYPGSEGTVKSQSYLVTEENTGA